MSQDHSCLLVTNWRALPQETLKLLRGLGAQTLQQELDDLKRCGWEHQLIEFSFNAPHVTSPRTPDSDGDGWQRLAGSVDNAMPQPGRSQFNWTYTRRYDYLFVRQTLYLASEAIDDEARRELNVPSMHKGEARGVLTCNGIGALLARDNGVGAGGECRDDASARATAEVTTFVRRVERIVDAMRANGEVERDTSHNSRANLLPIKATDKLVNKVLSLARLRNLAGEFAGHLGRDEAPFNCAGSIDPAAAGDTVNRAVGDES